MNRKGVANVLGWIMVSEGVLMLPSMIIGLVYSERETLGFVPACLFLVIIGLCMTGFKSIKPVLYAREGFFIVGISWIILSVFGAVPLFLSQFFGTPVSKSMFDCIFEIASGFTTTGASALTSVENLPKCMLFWRSFTHWVGGMGVLLFIMAIIPLSDNSSMHLMRAEVPGPTVGKLVPRMKKTAKILYGVYAAMTLILFILLVCGGMNWFDSICNSFATAGTGGFSVRDTGISYYNSAYIEIVLGIFMLLFGINFNLYYLILIGKFKEAFGSEELRTYVGIVIGSTALITWNVFKLFGTFGGSLRAAFFQVSSIVTTTGFATQNFSEWPLLSQMVILVLMVIGGCAGSTGGGLKVSRVMILFKSFVYELRHQMKPRSNRVARLEGNVISDSLMHGTLVYFAMYCIILSISTLLLSFDSAVPDFLTAFSAELSCLNNIGPGLGSVVGPCGNFSSLNGFSKILLSFNMLIGRLEIFPILMLFSPAAWRRGNV